jgi:hypothetical protein
MGECANKRGFQNAMCVCFFPFRMLSLSKVTKFLQFGEISVQLTIVHAKCAN